MPWEWSDRAEAQRHALRLLRDKHAESCRRQHAACSYEELAADLPDTRETEQTLYERLHCTLLLTRLATRLSPRQQAVLNLLGEDYELHEIAAQLGVSLGAVKRYVHLIRQKAIQLRDSDATFCPASVGCINGITPTGGMNHETMDEWNRAMADDGSNGSEYAGGGVNSQPPCV